MNLEMLISAVAIERRVAKVASELNGVYKGQELTLVMVLKGSFCLAADLMRRLEVPCRLEMVQAQSYGDRGMERGELFLRGLDRVDLQGRHVLLLDDIFDSGNTLSKIAHQIGLQNPASLKSLVLLEKKVERTTSYRPDYVLFEIENHFVVGYGLDFKELYRNLPAIYKVQS